MKRTCLFFILACLVPLPMKSGLAQMTFKPGEGWTGRTPGPASEFRTDRDDFLRALAVYQSGEARKAMTLADDVVATYQTGPWVERAMLLKARAYFRLNDLARSEQQLAILQKRFPGTMLGAEISDLRMAIANARLGAGRDSGLRSLERMVEDNPYGPRSDEAQYNIGVHHLEQKSYAEAAEAFTLILAHYPDSRYREDAVFLRAKASYLDNTGPQRDAAPYEEARQGLIEYLREFPNGKNAGEANGLLLRVNNALAQKLFLIGEFYRAQKQTRAAERYYQAAVMRYPKSPWAKRARAQLPIGWEPPPMPKPAEEAAPEAPEAAPEGRTDVEPAPKGEAQPLESYDAPN